jgi:Gpi18-like mannosyltransferase
LNIVLDKNFYFGEKFKSSLYTWFETIRNQYLAIALAILISLIARMYLSQFDGYGFDISLFKIWSRGVHLTGFSNFYHDVRSDYPPFYIYILWVVGAFYKIFVSSSFNLDSPIFTVLLKMPAIIADIVTALLIFRIVKKHSDFKIAYLSMIAYAFNPAIIYDSAIWGQVDSIYTLFLIMAIMFFVSDKPVLAGSSFAIAVLTKAQSLVLLPLLLFIMLKKYSLLTFAKVLAVSFTVFLAIALPFYINTSFFELFKLYFSSYVQYPYSSLNAFNIWAFAGLFQPDNTRLFFIEYRTWGFILFILFFIYVAFIILKSKDDKLIYLASAMLFFGFFMLFTRIHERYLFPMFAPLAVAMTFDRRLSYVYVLATFSFLFNLHFVLEETRTGIFPNRELLIPIISGINLVLLFYTIYCFPRISIFMKKLVER